MSDAKVENKNRAPDGASGRMLSRARRQAMSQGGKANIKKTGQKETLMASPMSMARVAPPAVNSIDEAGSGECGCHRQEPAAFPVSQGRSELRGADCGCHDNQPTETQVLDALCSLVESESAGLEVPMSKARQLCQERRRHLSQQGKTALGKSSAGVLRRRGSIRGDGRKSGVLLNGLSGRAAAQARREELCRLGRGDSPACRPSGRVRVFPDAPAKVEEGSTLSGNLVTGTQVERNRKMTGIEAGTCRLITGTEYIGMEQYGQLCSTIPDPAPSKVGSSQTARGQRVSGTEVGHSVHVTGDRQGGCQSVTGNEYLGAEQFESFCATKSSPGPRKGGMSMTQSGQSVSGTQVGRTKKVTGDEPGACQKLTGSQYYQPEQFGEVCQGDGVPHKVSVMSTVRGRSVTGTDVAPGHAVTGGEFGACRDVTGTEYAGLQQYQACNREPILMPEKVRMSTTWRDQPVSGPAMEYSAKVTGDEQGICQPISGSEYIGPDSYLERCNAESLTSAGQRIAALHGEAGAGLTGVKQGNERVTGRARGDFMRLSGTPYSDDAQYSRVNSGDTATRSHPLTRGPADRMDTVVRTAVMPVKGGFSVLSPARSAQTSQLNRITGTAYGTQGRITGPVNLAAGLVSGTPEFRYREDSFQPISFEPAGQGQETGSSAMTMANRVTGEGREEGFSITGSAWQRGGRITGTEGSSVSRRNPTLRGDARSMQVPARMRRENQAVIQPSKITGSSGNAASGSTITYSGGARG
jgi:Carboxysome shell peptide mid-region.